VRLRLAPHNVVEGNIARRPQMYDAFAAVESDVWPPESLVSS